MKEIKFRAWNLKPYGENVFSSPVPALTMVPWEDMQDDRNHWLNAEKWGDKFIPLQYIGVEDKSGKYIYEGDILEQDHGKFGKKHRGVIERNQGGPIFIKVEERQSSEPMIYEATADIQMVSFLQSCEVIGNIYESPELLEAATQK